MPTEPTSQPRLPRWLLVAGLLCGIGLAAGDLVLRRDALPDDAVARVNDKLIARDAWLRAVAAVASERRTPLTQEDQRLILDRLIDEELLVQHGLSLGLIEQDRRLRGQLVQDVLMSAQAGADGAVADEGTLRRYYDDHQDFFARPARLRVAAYQLTAATSVRASLHESAQGSSPADALRQLLLQHKTAADVPTALARPFEPALPEGLLPAAELRTYLGPELTEAALKFEAGAVSAPLPHGSDTIVLQVLQTEPGRIPAFEEVREQVVAELRRHEDETAVRGLLSQLRESCRVVVRGDLP